MKGLLICGIEFRRPYWFAARSGDAQYFRLIAAVEKNYSIAIPCSSSTRCVADVLCGATGKVDAPQFAGGKEPNRVSIRRPKGRRDEVGARNGLGIERIEPSKPELRPAVRASADKRESRSIRRNQNRFEIGKSDSCRS